MKKVIWIFVLTVPVLILSAGFSGMVHSGSSISSGSAVPDISPGTSTSTIQLGNSSSFYPGAFLGVPSDYQVVSSSTINLSKIGKMQEIAAMVGLKYGGSTTMSFEILINGTTDGYYFTAGTLLLISGSGGHRYYQNAETDLYIEKTNSGSFKSFTDFYHVTLTHHGNLISYVNNIISTLKASSFQGLSPVIYNQTLPIAINIFSSELRYISTGLQNYNLPIIGAEYVTFKYVVPDPTYTSTLGSVYDSAEQIDILAEDLYVIEYIADINGTFSYVEQLVVSNGIVVYAGFYYQFSGHFGFSSGGSVYVTMPSGSDINGITVTKTGGWGTPSTNGGYGTNYVSFSMDGLADFHVSITTDNVYSPPYVVPVTLGASALGTTANTVNLHT